MIAIDADHVAQALENMRLKGYLVFFFGRIRTRIEIAVALVSTNAPEIVFGPEEHSVLIARIRERGIVRIMRAADEIKPGLLHHRHVAPGARIGHGIAPSRMVLMHIGAMKVTVLCR